MGFRFRLQTVHYGIEYRLRAGTVVADSDSWKEGFRSIDAVLATHRATTKAQGFSV